MQDRRVRALDAPDEVGKLVAIHQETDLAQFHAVYGHAQRTGIVQGTQHEAIAAQCHHGLGLRQGNVSIEFHQCFAGLAGDGSTAGDERKAHG